MKIIEDLKKMPIPFLVGTGLLIGAFVINIIGFSLPYWSDRSLDSQVLHEGLWRRCAGVGDQISCDNYDVQGIVLFDWFMATRAFAVLGLICGIASVVLVILYIVLEKLRNQLIYIIDVALCFITAGCILLSILIYESEVNNLSSGWALSVIALLLFNAAGALFFKEIGSIKVDAT